MTALLDTPTAPAPVTRPAVLGPLGRLGAVALVAGAALNTGQAVLARALGRTETNAERLAGVDAHPVGTLIMIFGGMLGVVLLLIGFQAVARALRESAPRAARTGGALTFVGALGFFGVHVLMLLSYAAAGFEDRAAAVALLDHIGASPLGLVLLVPFLLGMFGGALALTIGLFRTSGVPRWVPACWALFLPLDLLAAKATPVDPHWLFLAGAVGIALTARRAQKS